MRVTRAQRITDLYDPESLITGAEVEAGFTYENSRRLFFPDLVGQMVLADAKRGKLKPEWLVRVAPRFKKTEIDLSYLDETTSFLP